MLELSKEQRELIQKTLGNAPIGAAGMASIPENSILKLSIDEKEKLDGDFNLQLTSKEGAVYTASILAVASMNVIYHKTDGGQFKVPTDNKIKKALEGVETTRDLRQSPFITLKDFIGTLDRNTDVFDFQYKVVGLIPRTNIYEQGKVVDGKFVPAIRYQAFCYAGYSDYMLAINEADEDERRDVAIKALPALLKSGLADKEFAKPENYMYSPVFAVMPA